MKPLPARLLGILPLLLFSLCFIVSCGSTDTAITAVYPRVVYSYESEHASPSVRLSVFGEVTGDAWRYEKLSISHEESGMIWSTDSLESVPGKNGNTQFIGYSSFTTMEPAFHSGIYKATWYLKNGSSTTMEFSLGAQNPELPMSSDATPSILVQDSTGAILFAGQRNNTFTSPDTVRAAYPDAVLYRSYVLKSNPRVLYLYPPEYVRNNTDHE